MCFNFYDSLYNYLQFSTDLSFEFLEYKRNVKQFTSKDFPAFTVCNQHLFEKILFEQYFLAIYHLNIEKTHFLKGYDTKYFIKKLYPNSNTTKLFPNSNSNIYKILYYIITSIVDLNSLDSNDPNLNRSRLIMKYFSKYLDVNDIYEFRQKNQIHESLQGKFYSLVFFNFQTTTRPF